MEARGGSMDEEGAISSPEVVEVSKSGLESGASSEPKAAGGQRKEPWMRPRGRAPNGPNGRPMVWEVDDDGAAGKWVPAGGAAAKRRR